MRVLQVHWAFPPTTGGVESHVADLAAGLSDRGCAVTVLTGEAAPDRWAGVRIWSSEFLNLDRVRAGRVVDADLDRELERVIMTVRPEVVHGHNLHHFAAGPAIALDRLGTRYGLRLFHTFHETWPDVLHKDQVYLRWARNYATSAHVQAECAARLGFTPVLRPLGIRTSEFRALRPPCSGTLTPVIVHPARLLPWKGVHVSVQMLALLAERGLPARLIITDTAKIADWDGELAGYRARIVRMIGDLGLTDRVELRPARYRDMPRLYEEADVVVYPTVAAEPYGLVPLEAMSAGRPVVASRCGGITETVVDGVTGWLVEPGDAETMAARVATLLSNPALAQRMGAAGRQRARDDFDLHHYISALLADYATA